MPVEIRLPNITATTEREQLAQVKSYLYQLAQQLQWAMDNISANSTSAPVSTDSKEPQIGLPSGVLAQSTFNAIKPLIIQSKEIISAYYREIEKLLAPDYVSEEEYLDRVGSNIRAGVLYYDSNGIPIYGLEIGQRNVLDGIESFVKYARFTEGRISLYENGDEEILCISGKTLFLNGVAIKTNAPINGSYIETTIVQGSCLDIHTAYDDFNGDGNERQTIFVFGSSGFNIVSGVAMISNNGEYKWNGTDNASISIADGGLIRIHLPSESNDKFTLISGEKFIL